MNGRLSKVCKKKSPPSELWKANNKLCALPHFERSWPKYKDLCCKELITSWFLVMQFSSSSKNCRVYCMMRRVFLVVYSTCEELLKIHSHTLRGEKGLLGKRGVSLICMTEGPAHASGENWMSIKETWLHNSQNGKQVTEFTAILYTSKKEMTFPSHVFILACTITEQVDLACPVQSKTRINAVNIKSTAWCHRRGKGKLIVKQTKNNDQNCRMMRIVQKSYLKIIFLQLNGRTCHFHIV